MSELRPVALAATPLDTRVIFVGGHLTFSKHAMMLLTSEHPGTEFIRLGSLRELSETVALRGEPSLTVIEDALIEPLLDAPEELARLAGTGRLTLAYREPLTAKRLISLAQTTPSLESVGVLPLNAEIEVFLSMFNLLMCGEVLYPRAVIEAVPEMAQTATPSQLRERLTPREWEILEKIAEGQQNKMIATGLNLSEHTVKLHVHHVLKKLGVSNRTGAACWFANHGAAS